MVVPRASRIVIIGGGVIGCSIAYHLAKRGERDVVLLERLQLTHGATWHAAGLVGQLRSSSNLTRLMRYGAELYGKLEADELAEQLHFLGRWYEDARIAPETQGGYGEAVIIALRDGRKGRPTYPKLYRHTLGSRPDAQQMKTLGWPTNTKTRPLLINQIEQAIREKSIPALTRTLVMECRTFVRQKTNPSPRALDGANDDRVMAFGIALEMYRQFGTHEKRARRRSGVPKQNRHQYPWERSAA
jgi:hypothetical protein